MKKKLEAELISIAHRILKLKNRVELDQLQQETLKLYEKISVLRFVEDNFADVKPTIGYASAEETLEEIYGIEEVAPVHANEVEAKEEEKKAQAKSDKPKVEDKSKAESEEPKAESEKPGAEDKPEGDANPEQKVEEYQASEEEKEHTDESKVESQDESEVGSQKSKEEEPQAEEEPQTENKDEQPETEEPATTNPQPVTEEDVKAMEASAEAVYKKEDNSTPEEEEKAADAEVITIEPDKDAKTDEVKLDFGFAFERKPAPEEATKQKEITFEDYADYKEPEFVKKGDQSNAESPKPNEEPQAENQSEQPATQNTQPETPVRDWRDWEPSTSPAAEKKEEPKAESQKSKDEPQAISQQPQIKEQPAIGTQPATQNPTPNTQHLKAITLGLNDRIAFEKNLFGGSGEDLNRVISQLNTMDRFEDAKDFIRDLVKPDYNNWQGKEEYEERLMELVEKRFS